MQVREAVESAAAAVLCVSVEDLRLKNDVKGGLRFDSPQAEAIVARVEGLLGTGPLAEVKDLQTGEPATLETLTELLETKRTGSEAMTT